MEVGGDAEGSRGRTWKRRAGSMFAEDLRRSQEKGQDEM